MSACDCLENFKKHSDACPVWHAELAKRGGDVCNLCGLSCFVEKGKYDYIGGLLETVVAGGFGSTPGNGGGALDDTMAYRFSLCEWCCDWLFQKMVKPPYVYDYMHAGESETFRPAHERVAQDEWRRYKSEFWHEHARREAARNGLLNVVLSHDEARALREEAQKCPACLAVPHQEWKTTSPMIPVYPCPKHYQAGTEADKARRT